MRAWLHLGVAALLAAGGCARREEAPRVVHGSVFLRGADGQAIRLALARVYFLTAQDRRDMAAEAARIRQAAAPEIAAARAELEAAARAAKEAEARPLALVAEKMARLEELKKNGAGWAVLASFENDLATAEAAWRKVMLAGIEAMQPALDRHKQVTTSNAEAIWRAETTPRRAVALAALTDAAGDFSVAIPAEADTLLVEADAATGRIVWLLPVAAIKPGEPLLLSEHNQHH